MLKQNSVSAVLELTYREDEGPRVRVFRLEN